MQASKVIVDAWAISLYSNEIRETFYKISYPRFIMEKPSGNVREGLGIDAIVVVPEEISADSDKMHKVIRLNSLAVPPAALERIFYSKQR